MSGAATATVELAIVHGTEAVAGWAGGHVVIVDRPEGRAGGMGLGFNGGQLLALAIGGCLANDLRDVAHDLGVALGDVRIGVSLDLAGDPLRATGAEISVACKTTDGSDPQPVIDRALAGSTVANSVRRVPCRRPGRAGAAASV
ncbi:MAG: OsmC family protein [Rhodobacteraceae bacterium]|nr:OsmC family protein [Paracoccaceae bacterium]